MSASHFFPVVSRTDGLAGTQWLTSVQIVNPQPHELVITARLSAEGTVQTETFVVPQGQTHNWDDFLGTVFEVDGNGALFLEAEADNNDQLSAELRAFAASMRISTENSDGGSFGQGVPSLDPVAGFLGDWTAFFPAVSLWGQPGTEGFRTNVGFWNIGAEDARLRLRLVDASGLEVWADFVTVHRHDPFVMGLPRNLDLDTATLVVDSMGEWVDCAVYISLVDNITGDGTFHTSQLMDPDSAASKAGTGDSARMRALFLADAQ